MRKSPLTRICLNSRFVIMLRVCLFAEGTSSKEEDAESGKGPSVPQSPHSVEGAIGGPKCLDSDFEDSKTPDK